MTQNEVIMSKKKKPDFDLDAEEDTISDSFDRGEWKSVDNLKEEKSKARLAAANYFRKSAHQH
jgi:hypothetical protein